MILKKANRETDRQTDGRTDKAVARVFRTGVQETKNYTGDRVKVA